MANEVLYVAPFIKSIMAADAQLIAAIPAARHFHRRAPQGATSPCVIYRFQDSDTGQTQNRRKLIGNFIYQVFVASKNTLGDVDRTAVNRIDALFSEDNIRRRAYVAPDTTALTFNVYLDALGYIHREQPGAREEETYIHTGAFYRFEVFNGGL